MLVLVVRVRSRGMCGKRLRRSWNLDGQCQDLVLLVRARCLEDISVYVYITAR